MPQREREQDVAGRDRDVLLAAGEIRNRPAAVHASRERGPPQLLTCAGIERVEVAVLTICSCARARVAPHAAEEQIGRRRENREKPCVASFELPRHVTGFWIESTDGAGAVASSRCLSLL